MGEIARREEEMLTLRRFIVVLSSAAALLAFLPASPSPAAVPTRYVALGDSYSAASGVLPPDLLAPPLCLRSSRNYPHDIARATGAS